MYFLFYPYTFDDTMKFEYITQILKFDFVKNKKSFWSGIKQIFHIFTSALF